MCNFYGLGTSLGKNTACSIHLNINCFVCYIQEPDTALQITGVYGMWVYKAIQNGNCTVCYQWCHHAQVDSQNGNIRTSRMYCMKFWMPAWDEVGDVLRVKMVYFRNLNIRCIKGEGTEETVGLLWTVLMSGFWRMLRNLLVQILFSDAQEKFCKAAGMINGSKKRCHLCK